MSKKPKTRLEKIVVSRKKIYKTPRSALETIDAAKAKKILGWREVTKEDDWDYKDYLGNYVALDNNVVNRPIEVAEIRKLKWELIKGKWQVNGEPIILGETGLVLNGQHTLLMLVDLDLEWSSENSSLKDLPDLKGNPEIQKFVTVGIKETEEVIQSMDTCRSRTFSDAIYRSEFLQHLKTNAEKKKAAKALQVAVMMLWKRTAYSEDICFAYSPERTISEMVEMLDCHSTITKSVAHIMEVEGKERKVSPYISLGYATCLMYLMGTCQSDFEQYSMSRVEDVADFTSWDQAEKFWSEFSEGKLPEIKKALLKMKEDGSLIEKVSIICKAWNSYYSSGKVTRHNVRLRYKEDDLGVKRVAPIPCVGGLDQGE